FVKMGTIPRYVKITRFGELLNACGLPLPMASLAEKVAKFLCKILPLNNRKHAKGVEVGAARDFGEDFRSFWDSISSHYPCIVKRDNVFLRWRYLNQPLWPYTILTARRHGNIKGFAVVREGMIKRGKLKGKKIGVISDILIDPKEAACTRELLRCVTEFFKDRKAMFIKCDILNNHVRRALKACNFVRIMSRNSFMLNVYDKKLSGSSLKVISARNNWFISSGDSDLDFD
ncbi:MAG: hypothetical protein JW994_02285, partial [Candidatus Omnitrophica bacterium]|nr:hypothetical protein [Candidatus Omnitrophota bacterium]